MSDASVPTGTNSSAKTPLPIRVRLSLMMFLQYWPLGLWAVTVYAYLGANTGPEGSGIFSPGFIGTCMSGAAIGSLIAPAIFGWIADRYCPAQWMLAALHALAGVSLLVMWGAEAQWVFFLGILVYFQAFVPTVTLTNTIGLRHLRNVDGEFPIVRAWGTVGWVGTGLLVGWAWPAFFGESIEATRIPLMLGAIFEFVMAAYSLTLPHTPPMERAGESNEAQQRSVLWRNGAFVLFLGVSVLACIPSQAYNLLNLFLNQQGYEHAAAKMTLAQVSEVVCMVTMPWLLLRLGVRGLFLIGTLCWALRFLLLAAGSQWQAAWPVYTAIVIHGPCYVFVYVAGQIYIDRLVVPSRRGVAQGLHAIATTGFGHLFGAIAVVQTELLFLTPPGAEPPTYRWTEFWIVPAIISLAAALLFWLTFADATHGKEPPFHATDNPPSPADALTEPPSR